jgi:uncharacterized membrane protein
VAAQDRPDDVRSAERTITLTDAVVAIAMTLLVLPLVELVPEIDAHDLRASVADHLDVFMSFLISFLVIYVFWLAHERAFALVDRTGRGLRSLNMWWLLLVAFLPFPTALVGRTVTTDSVVFYIGTMFLLSAITSAMVQVAQRSAARDGTAPRPSRWRVVLTWTTTAVFAVCALVALADPSLGLFGLLLLLVVRVAEVVVSGPRRRA